MWVFATQGFVSIVADLDNEDNLLVRGRFRGDIEGVFPTAEVRETADADYRFRASLDRVDAGMRIAELAASIEYPNFKDAAPKGRHNLYLRIWSILIGEQDRLTPPKPGRWGAFFEPKKPKKPRRRGRSVDPELWAGLPLLPVKKEA